MKTIVLPLIVFLLAFAASLLGVLAATGNLNSESLNKMFGKQPSVQVEQEVPDEMDAFVQQLKDREKALSEERKKLDEEKKRVRLAQQDLDDMTSRLEQLIQQMNQLKADADKNREARITQAAQTLANMDPKKAAAALKDWPAERAAEVLQNVKEKDRAKILDQMDPAQAAQIIEHMKSANF